MARSANLLTQDFERHGVQSEGDKFYLRQLARTVRGVVEQPANPITPSICSSYSTNQPNVDAFLSPEIRGDLTSGILDLHSFDTELLSEVSASEMPYSTSPYVPVIEPGFENNSERFNSSEVNGRSQFEVNPLRSSTMEKERTGKDSSLAKIRVVVRKRPVNKKELARKEEDVITVDSGNSLTVHEPKVKVDLTAYVEKNEFVFDAVLDENVSNEEVYHETVKPIVPTIFQRTKATCFAYGQTGSGKTYTMQPLPLKAAQDMLNIMQQPQCRNQGFQLWLSFFEIYGGKLYDLLNERSKLCMREDGRQQVCIVGLKEFAVFDVETIKEYIERGNGSRSTGSTGANEESSRSHAILQLSIKKRVESKPDRLVGKFSFIDLAGSERGADTTDNDRQTRLEGAEINKSLLALKECIRALDNDQFHIPFRGSKLTEVLRDSFVGNSRTVMISCISPNSGSCEHTLNTLRYADRVKSLSKSNLKRDMSSSNPPSQRDTIIPNPPLYQSQVSEDFEESAAELDAAEEEEDYANPTISDNLQYTTDDRRRGFTGYDNNNNNNSNNNNNNNNNNARRYQESSEQQHIFLPQKKNMRDDDGRIEKSNSLLERNKPSFRDDDDDLEEAPIKVLLKEEDALVFAHRKEVEETIELVREEMKLLSEIDQPGSCIDNYVSRLNQLLSRKAAGIVNLQARLARFRRLLKEQEVLHTPANY